ncbi:MAG: DNA mismatch repair protein MutS, partial [Clostridiales bacterium]|nr:DNA mismatch repair protein MutS [Clostridiales bacterium]
SIVFLRKIVRGGASRSFGVEVAALAGVPEEVTSRAKKILRSLEKNDLTHGTIPDAVEEEEEVMPETFDIRGELNGIDVNSLTPMQALALLSEWKEKLK